MTMAHTPRKMKLGLIQVTSDYSWTVEQCIDEILTLTEQCLQQGADLVFMPEEAQYKGKKESPASLAEKYSADYLARCAALARQYEAYVAPWDYELGEDGKVYNTVFMYDRRGERIGKYRKTQITLEEIRKGISTSSDFPVFDLDFGKVGVMICFDNYYPEPASILALRGAELILYPLYGDTMKGRWETRTLTRAIDHSVYVASCQIHSSPREIKASFTGLFDPRGYVAHRVEEEGTCSVVEIDLNEPVISEMTGAGHGIYEYTKPYLLKLRNPEPFTPITMKVETEPWEKIRFRSDNR